VDLCSLKKHGAAFHETIKDEPGIGFIVHNHPVPTDGRMWSRNYHIANGINCFCSKIDSGAVTKQMLILVDDLDVAGQFNRVIDSISIHVVSAKGDPLNSSLGQAPLRPSGA